MMSWSPTARRNGVSGAVHLFSRQVWRDSRHGPALERVVRAALDDADRVNRLHATRAARFLEPDPQPRLALLRERLLTETESHVAAALTNELAALAPCIPGDVDRVLEECIATQAWQARLASTDRGGPDTSDPLVSLVLWLAIAQETPASTALATEWFTHPLGAPIARRVFWKIRPWLSLAASRAAERSRAFHLVKSTAEAMQSLRLAAEPADAAEIYKVADAIVDQIYFASGAFGAGDNERDPVPAQDGFAEEAFAVLDLLTEFKHPSIIHRLVETLGHLSPSAPRTAFLLIERAIRAGDAYTYDSMAADTTVGLIERYLTEFREVVSSDPEVLTAVRRVLDAFVRVGWPAAVSLSYRLGDAFR